METNRAVQPAAPGVPQLPLLGDPELRAGHPHPFGGHQGGVLSVDAQIAGQHARDAKAQAGNRSHQRAVQG